MNFGRELSEYEPTEAVPSVVLCKHIQVCIYNWETYLYKLTTVKEEPRPR